MRRNKGLSMLVAGLILAGLASCSVFVPTPVQELRLGLPRGSAYAGVASWTLDGTGPEGAQLALTDIPGASSSISLPGLIPGLWSFTLAGRDGFDQILWQGSFEALIREGAATTVSVTLGPLGDGMIARFNFDDLADPGLNSVANFPTPVAGNNLVPTVDSPAPTTALPRLNAGWLDFAQAGAAAATKGSWVRFTAPDLGQRPSVFLWLLPRLPDGGYSLKRQVILGTQTGPGDISGISSSPGFTLALHTPGSIDGKLRLELHDGTTGQVISHSLALVMDQWNHVGFSFDPELEEVNLFVNGQVFTAPLSIDRVAAFSTPRDLMVGGMAGSGDGHWFYAGGMDELQIFRGSVETDEIPLMIGTTAFGGGSGVGGDPWKVATAQHLDNVRFLPQGTYVQTGPISLSAYAAGDGWLPIGTTARAFSGTYDGQQHPITGIKINRPTTDFVGLFGSVRGGRLRNVRLQNVDITGQTHVGALAGELNNSVSNVVYSNLDPTVSRSSATGKVSATGSTSYAGGLVGYQWGNSSNLYQSWIIQSWAKVEVTGLSHVGGLVGRTYNYGYVQDSYAWGPVSGTSAVGALAGSQETGGDIQRSWAGGMITGPTAWGLVGGSGSSTNTDTYFDKDGTGWTTDLPPSIVGLSRTDMTDQAKFSGFDFATVWTMGSGSYPWLRWQTTDIPVPAPAPTYTLTFVANGATAGSAPPTQGPYTAASALSLPMNTGSMALTQTVPDGTVAMRLVGWNTEPDGSGTTYALGQSYSMPAADTTLYALWTWYGGTGSGGGLIFYENPSYVIDGWRWLEIMPSDLATAIPWSVDGGDVASSVDVPSAIANDVGAGAANTAAIVSAHGTARNTYAAGLVDLATDGGKTDWYLPSLAEWSLVYSNLVSSSLGTFTSYYWASNQVDANKASLHQVSGPTTGSEMKNTGYSVRGARMIAN